MAFKILGPNDADVVDVDQPSPRPNELLVEPLRVGICATDLELLEGTMFYLAAGQSSFPLIPGHEWVGRVVARGAEVTRQAVGDIVVGECSLGCGRCELCRGGQYHQCLQRRETGITGMPGAMTELMAYPSATAHIVPPSISINDAVYVEPLAVALRAIKKLNPAPGESVLVIGTGTIGCLATALLRHHYHLDVAVFGRRAEATARAVTMGGRLAAPGERFSRALEAAGTADAVNEGIDRLVAGGRLVLTGLTGEGYSRLPVDRIVTGDIEVVGSLGSPHVWSEVLEILDRGSFSPAELTAQTYYLKDVPLAFDRLRRVGGLDGKLVVAPTEGVP